MQNVNGSDGGALAGVCRATMIHEGCVAGLNFGPGRAFDFFAAGEVAGRISVVSPASKPLTTNATGVATGFNADKVDGKDASELAVRGYGATSMRKCAPCPPRHPLHHRRGRAHPTSNFLIAGPEGRWAGPSSSSPMTRSLSSSSAERPRAAR